MTVGSRITLPLDPSSDQCQRRLQKAQTLEECNIIKEATIHMMLSLRGGGSEQPEMSLGAGGKILQKIIKYERHACGEP